MKRSLSLMALLLVIVAAASSAFAQSREATEREIIRLEHEWADAVAHNDVDKMDELLPNDYIIISADGQTRTKGQLIADMKAGELKYEAYELLKLKVRLYGDTAIVTGTCHTKGRYGEERGGQLFEDRTHFMKVYVKREGRWSPVVRQVGQASLVF